MKKALAVLAAVATIGATTMTAPAQARGIGPGLAFGLAAGAIATGAAAAHGPYYGPGYGYYAYGPRYYGPAAPVHTLMTAGRTTGIATGAIIGNEQALVTRKHR